MKNELRVDKIYELNVIRLCACDNCRVLMDVGQTYYQVGIWNPRAAVRAFQFRYVLRLWGVRQTVPGGCMNSVTVSIPEYWRGPHQPPRSVQRRWSVTVHYMTETKMLRHPVAYVMAIEGYPYRPENEPRWKQLGRLVREQIGMPARNIPACLNSITRTYSTTEV